MAVDELAMSIGARGYFPHEPIFVEEDGDRLVVIEGNRRLAAVMLLLDPEARKRLKITDLPSITPAAAKELRMLPVVRTTRKDLWQYLGFKHVNGPAKWGSYAKAQYIADVRQKFGVPLEVIADADRRPQPDRSEALPRHDGHQAGRGRRRLQARGQVQGKLLLFPPLYRPRL